MDFQKRAQRVDLKKMMKFAIFEISWAVTLC